MGYFDLLKREYDFSQCWGQASARRGDFQLLVYKKREKLPDWLYGGIFYQVFPDRFFRAGNNPAKADAVICHDPEKLPDLMRVKANNDKNNLFYGGDLQGVTEKLDYLKTLGVTCLYLNPIFESSSNHKYNTADYSRIDEMLGGEDAFKTLLCEAKKRDIAVILDGVFNHTGSDSIYFNKNGNYPCVGAMQSEKSQYSKWYTFFHYPDSYESWWGIDTLPRVKSDEASYREFLFGQNGIVRRYTRMGIDGWRLDVADELPDSFIRGVRKAIKETDPDGLLIVAADLLIQLLDRHASFSLSIFCSLTISFSNSAGGRGREK
jgi:glycosidase